MHNLQQMQNASDMFLSREANTGTQADVNLMVGRSFKADEVDSHLTVPNNGNVSLNVPQMERKQNTLNYLPGTVMTIPGGNTWERTNLRIPWN